MKPVRADNSLKYSTEYLQNYFETIYDNKYYNTIKFAWFFVLSSIDKTVENYKSTSPQVCRPLPD